LLHQYKIIKRVLPFLLCPGVFAICVLLQSEFGLFFGAERIIRGVGFLLIVFCFLVYFYKQGRGSQVRAYYRGATPSNDVVNCAGSYPNIKCN